MINQVNPGIPGARDTRVPERMFHTSVEHWQQLLDGFLLVTLDLCVDLLKQARLLSFHGWAQTELFRELQKATDRFFKRQFADLTRLVATLHRMETKKLMTLNKEAKDDAETSASAELERRRLKNRVDQRTGPQPIREADRKRIEDSVRQEVDPFRQEVAEMAVSGPCAARLFLTLTAHS